MICFILFVLLAFIIGNLLNVFLSILLQDIIINENIEDDLFPKNRLSFISDIICSKLSIESRKGKFLFLSKSDWFVLYLMIVFGIVFYFLGITVSSLNLLVALTLFYITSEIDISYMFVCDEVLLIFGCIGIFFSLLSARFFDSIFGAIIGFLIYFIIYKIVKFIYKDELFGFGDVLYNLVLGIFLGKKLILFASVLSFVVAMIGSFIVYIFCNIRKKIFNKNKTDTVAISFSEMKLPFVPFMSIAAFISLLFGNMLINMYLAYLFK